jgi:hypothetical protein
VKNEEEREARRNSRMIDEGLKVIGEVRDALFCDEKAHPFCYKVPRATPVFLLIRVVR